MKSKRTLLKMMSALAVAGLLAAPLAQAQKLEEINYLLPAPPVLPAFIPWVLAQQRGYYAQEGLKVTFQVGKGGVDVAKQVGAGNAAIGGGLGDTPIIARAQGIPVKAVAVLGAGSLMQLVSHKDENIESPRELKGKTVTTLAYTDTTYYALLGMLSKVNMTKNDANIQAAVGGQAAGGHAIRIEDDVDLARERLVGHHDHARPLRGQGVGRHQIIHAAVTRAAGAGPVRRGRRREGGAVRLSRCAATRRCLGARATCGLLVRGRFRPRQAAAAHLPRGPYRG